MNDASPNASPPKAGDHQLIEVRSKGSLLRTWPGLVISIVVAATLIVAVAFFRLAALGRSDAFFVASVLAAAAFAGWLAYKGMQQRAAHRLRRRLADWPGDLLKLLKSRIEGVVPLLRSTFARSLLRELARALVAEGHASSTIRIAPDGQTAEIVPITVPFEPRRLDDVGDGKPIDAQSANESTGSGGPLAASPPSGFRRFQRNMLLRGGWLLLAVWLWGWSISALEAYKSGRVTISFMMWTVSTLLVVLVPVGANRIIGKQWFAVPGGLVLRRGSWRRQRWSVHLFEREQSVLLVCKLFRHQWLAVVADSDACSSAVGTKREIEFALQAWLSPLAPPKPKQLTDLL